MAYLDVINRVQNLASQVWAPPPNLSISQWADEYLYLSPEDSAEPGKYKTERAPYQRGMLDAVSDPGIREVVYCTSSQIGKSLMAKAVLGYHMHQDPGPILVMMPTVSMAETFSKDRLAPMVRDTPVLTPLVADPKSRTSGNTVLKKNFRGGHLTLVGSTAPTEISSRPIRIVFADEVDRYPASAGIEGDPIFLARQRSVTFYNRKFIMASTPTVEGVSRIWRAFEASDMRYYHVPCPHCHELHVLKWANVVYEHDDPATARMVCPACGAMFHDADKLWMLQHGEWMASKPGNGIAGFHISALYSPWQTFADVVKEFLDKRGNKETLKTFVNLQLGECWEDREGETVQADILMARREVWEAVPDDVVLLTCGVDTQDDRLEATLIGWTGTEQGRVISHHVFWGSPGEPHVWRLLDEFLLGQWVTYDARTLRIRACCIDSGGHFSQQVYDFCDSRTLRNVVPIKGRNGAHPIWPTRGHKTKLSVNVRLFIVGVDTAKDQLRANFAVSNKDLPHYVSFSADLNDDYFRQLTVERRRTETSRTGHQVRKWVKPPGARNEALDCFVYSLCALNFLKSGGTRLRLVAQRANVPVKQPDPDPGHIEMPPPERRKPRRRASSAVL